MVVQVRAGILRLRRQSGPECSHEEAYLSASDPDGQSRPRVETKAAAIFLVTFLLTRGRWWYRVLYDV